MSRSRLVTGAVLWVMVVGGCGTSPDPALDEHKAIVLRVFDEVLNQGRYELFSERYDPTFVKHVDGATFSLSEEMAQAKGTRALASDLVVTVDRIAAEGDLVAVAYTGRGTNDGAYGGVPPTGKAFVMAGATVYRFQEGRIVEEWTYYNELELLRQLGLSTPGR